MSGSVKLNRVTGKHQIQTYCTLDEDLKKFWEIESSESEEINEEDTCEKLFKNTTERDPEGKFVVELTFKENFMEWGNSREIAKRRFLNLETRFGNCIRIMQNS